MEDKTIVCVDCHEPFVFAIGEQQFYSERGLAEVPKRCKACRSARRRRLGRRRQQAAEPVGTEAMREASEASKVTEAKAESPTVKGAPARGNGHEGAAPAAASGEGAQRSFWEERPQWVKEALEKAALAKSGRNGAPRAAAVDTPTPGPEVAPLQGVEAFNNGNGRGASNEDPKRRRRRRSRRRKKSGLPIGERTSASES